MKIVLSTFDIIFYVFKIIAVIIIITYILSGCYEYRKFPNTKRVTKREVNKAMKFSTSDYSIPKNKFHK